MEIQRYVDVEISGDREALTHFPELVEERLDREWSRDRESEERGTRLSGGDPVYAFSCTERRERPAANLVLMFEEERRLCVANIVPKEYSDLSYEEYNAIAGEFHDRFAKPVADRLGLDLYITSGSESITEYLSEEALQKLRRFSHAANKTTGSSHPMDRERWLAFLLAVHSEDAPLDSDVLTRWLQAEGGWPEDKALDLASEFTFARELLEAYDYSR